MTNVIPYTQSAFNKILNNSRIFHNNAEINPSAVKTYIVDNNNDKTAFIQSFLNELELFIQSNMYDIEIRKKVKKYLAMQMEKYGQFMSRDMLNAFSNIDSYYGHIFKEHNFIQNILAPYFCENTLICD